MNFLIATLYVISGGFLLLVFKVLQIESESEETGGELAIAIWAVAALFAIAAGVA